MNKKDKMMMELLSSQINFYGEVLSQTTNLHRSAIHVGELRLASVAKRASAGLSELVGQLSFQQDTIMKRNDAVHIPIESEKEVHEIHFKDIYTKNNPLW